MAYVALCVVTLQHTELCCRPPHEHSPYTYGHQAACQLDGARDVTHLVDRVAQVVEGVSLGGHRLLAGVQLLQSMLHPKHSMVVVGVVIGRLAHVEAVVHCQDDVGVESWKEVWVSIQKTASQYTVYRKPQSKIVVAV